MEMLRETFFIQGLLASVFIAVVAKLIVWRNYHRLLVSTEDMDRPKRSWIGTLKKKFENYYALNTSVKNTGCIVDKYFEANKVLGINSVFLEQIPGFCGILCVLLGCAGAVRGIWMNTDINFWGRSLILSTAFGIGIFMLDYLTKMDHMRRMIRMNLIYYLDNVLPNRVNKKLSKQSRAKREEARKEEQMQKEKEETQQIAGHWEQIASTREFSLTPEDIQTLKDFINDL
ncbi:MAG: hypothetical protein ACLTBR_12060 [Anaerostipes sp.]|uniref:hypothetical protein n=1 Tax=Anaerostipes sp. TaxID=1872530 RepID=UPI0039959DF8